MVTVFFSYSHADESLRDELEKHLSLLKRQGVIGAWHDRRIGAGQELHGAIDSHVENDQIILLLVSSDFLASDYCYDREMVRAMGRHESGEAIVIPVILRACDWTGAPFGKLMATPPDGRPVTQWPDRDQAFFEITKAIKAAAVRLMPATNSMPPSPTVPADGQPQSRGSEQSARSSNLRVAKHFTERERDLFRREAFEYLAKFFENSVKELCERNPGVEGDVRRIDANRFVAALYRDGHAVARCTVFMGGFAGGIAYSASETAESNSYNENLSVEADDQTLFLRSMGFSSLGHHGQDAKLTLEGGAELYWSMFVAPLQRL